MTSDAIDAEPATVHTLVCTVGAAQQVGRKCLAGPGSTVGRETPQLDAEVLLRHVLGLSRSGLYTRPEASLTTEQWQAYRALLQRRAAGEPVAYLTGRREFMGLELAVDRHVLIPRPETELLVGQALTVLDSLDAPGNGYGPAAGRLAVADAGTGSGAIAVSLMALTSRPERLDVYATDVSWGALRLARVNAARLLGPAARRVAFVQCRLLSAVRGPFHLVAANLPYVPSAEVAALSPSVVGYEPHQALHGGPDGLDLYRALLHDLPAKLVAGGVLLMECDPRQVATLRDLATAAIAGGQTAVYRDLAGRDRVLVVRAPQRAPQMED